MHTTLITPPYAHHQRGHHQHHHKALIRHTTAYTTLMHNALHHLTPPYTTLSTTHYTTLRLRSKFVKTLPPWFTCAPPWTTDTLFKSHLSLECAEKKYNYKHGRCDPNLERP